MRAILIDPFERTIEEVETRKGARTLDELYRLLRVEDIDHVRLTDGCPREDVWVDGEGLFKPDQRYFKLDTYLMPLAGRGLVLGTDYDGESIGTKMTLSEARRRFGWVRPDLRYVRTDTTRDTINHPVFGKMDSIVHTPVFRTGDGTLIKEWRD